MTTGELREALRQAEQDWYDRQNRVNELLSWLKVAQGRAKYAADKIDSLRQSLYEAEKEAEEVKA